MANKAIKGKIGSDTVYFVPYFPVGSIYITISEDNPSTIFGGTWKKIEGKFLIGASTSYKVSTTGGSSSHTHTNSSTGSTVLTSSHIPQHSHSVGAHSHGLNSHVHSVGAHAHGVGTLKNANATITGTFSVGGSVVTNTATGGIFPNEGMSGCFSVSTRTDATTWVNANYQQTGRAQNKITLNSTHTHTISGSTANSTAFNTGAASGSTANSTAFNTGNWGTASPSGHTHTVSNTGSSSNLPPYIAVYIWKRTA